MRSYFLFSVVLRLFNILVGTIGSKIKEKYTEYLVRQHSVTRPVCTDCSTDYMVTHSM